MKRNDTVTIVISTKQKDEDYIAHVKKAFSHPKNEILVYENNGEYSLTEIYNKGLNDSENDIVIFMHDDLILESKNLGAKIIKLFEKNKDYGIIGIAGTDNLTSGMWWQNRENMFGVVGHIQNGKKHINKYSPKVYNEVLKDVVVVDGLFIMTHKKRLKNSFNEEFKKFHFYDIPFCVDNFMNGVKIGVTTKFNITHKSIGITNKDWERNKLYFEALYEKNFPLTV